MPGEEDERLPMQHSEPSSCATTGLFSACKQDQRNHNWLHTGVDRVHARR
jgi:hypothetical protein